MATLENRSIGRNRTRRFATERAMTSKPKLNKAPCGSPKRLYQCNDTATRPTARRSLLHWLAFLVFTLLACVHAGATTQPENMSVVIPIGTNNAAGAGAFSCNLSGTVLDCTGDLSTSDSTDDILLTGITFDGVAFDATVGEIIPGLASVFVDGGGGTNVNAEWGDGDDASDQDDDPFVKAGHPSSPQESTDIDVINATLLQVFRTFNVMEGVDGEDENFRIDLIFERGVSDDNPDTLDDVPEIMVFERGLNSDVSLQLLLADGGISNELFVDRSSFRNSGFNADTVEISGGQAMGVVGVDLNEFTGAGFDPATDTVIGVRFGSAGNGADIFGVFGTTKNPEPASDWGDAPDTYGTLADNNGPSHLLSRHLFIGLPPDSEGDGQPNEAATGDDPVAEEDEALQYQFSSGSFGPGDTFSVTVPVLNDTGASALLCGWIDFNDNGTFENTDTAAGATNAERACADVPDGLVSTGTNPDTITLDFIIPDDFADTSSSMDTFMGRFRITSDWSDETVATLSGEAQDGEVEDIQIDNSTLPVSVSSFSSMDGENGLEVRWSTVSETRNAGFYLWGDRGNGVELLTPDPIPAEPGDPLTPRSYRVELAGVRTDEVTDLALSAVDYQGDEEVYGLFQPARAYGEHAKPAPIRWNAIAAQVASRSALRAQWARQAATRGASTVVHAVDVAVTGAGMQSVSWQRLADAGLDLTGVEPGTIAVTLNGNPVPRQMISGDAGGFRPGDSIRFWGEQPAGRDALYLDHYRYRIAVDAARAVEARSADERSGPEASFYMARLAQDIDNAYNFASKLEDPWYAARLRADRDNTYTTRFAIGDELVTGQPGRLEVRLAGLTDFPADPDHHIRVAVNDQVVGERIFEGATVQTLDLALPAGLLVPGVNEVAITAPGETEARFDISLIDTVALEYAAAPALSNNRLLMPQLEGPDRYTVAGLENEARVYAWDGEALFSVPAQTTTAYADPDVLFRADFEPDESVPQALAFSTLAGVADYWVSSDERVQRPEVVAEIAENTLFDGPTDPDFLVIGHPAFLPLSPSEAHPLNEFIEQREAEGWRVALFDIAELQAHYAGGMALPEAVNRFLADAEARFEYEHVLLVGGDSYDYTDNLGLGSISFIPTHYAATRFIPHTPSDSLLADLDGDGLSDKAIGRWPVRSHDDLQATVDKTLAWPDIANPESAVWVIDAEEAGTPSFARQANQMMEPLLGQQWPSEQLDRLAFDEAAPRPGLSLADSLRADLFDRLEQGRAITGFIGHGAPSMWTFRGLLTPKDLAELDNIGNPTLISTLTCYTSYFVSPFSDTVAHRWMNGYREDTFGNPIPGTPNGAVAIHGAATLSDYAENGTVARSAMSALLDGATLGEAVERARLRALGRGYTDQVVNWTLLGDPTLSLPEAQ